MSNKWQCGPLDVICICLSTLRRGKKKVLNVCLGWRWGAEIGFKTRPKGETSPLFSSPSHTTPERDWNNSSIRGGDTLCSCRDIRVVKGWTRSEGKRGISVWWKSMTTESSGQNHHAWGWARVPSFLSVLMVPLWRCMGFNYIWRVVQLTQSLTKTLSCILVLSHWGATSFLLCCSLLNKKKHVIVCIQMRVGSSVMQVWTLCLGQMSASQGFWAGWQAHVWASGQQLLWRYFKQTLHDLRQLKLELRAPS